MQFFHVVEQRKNLTWADFPRSCHSFLSIDKWQIVWQISSRFETISPRTKRRFLKQSLQTKLCMYSHWRVSVYVTRLNVFYNLIQMKEGCRLSKRFRHDVWRRAVKISDTLDWRFFRLDFKKWRGYNLDWFWDRKSCHWIILNPIEYPRCRLL